MNGFADIHTHLLPATDDGAEDLQSALELVEMAWENGTRTLFLTPHFRGIYRKNTPEMLEQRFEAFCREVAARFPKMRLYLGNEIHYHTDVPDRLLVGSVLPLGGSEYALVEFDNRSMRSHVVSAVMDTVQAGYTPIIAHAERYEVFLKNATLVDEVVELGALIQLNADSVLGKHGFVVKRFCHKLLRRQQAHFIGSDAHDRKNRPPLLRECFLHIHKKYGDEYAARVFCENAQAVIENRMI